MDQRRRNLLVGGSLLGVVTLGGLLPSMCAMQNIRSDRAMSARKPPQRPAGEARPVLEEDIAPTLARLDVWYAAHLPPARHAFNPPATEAQLDAFERLIGLELPAAYRQLYHWHDGENDDRWGHIFGLPLLPLREAASQWKSWADVLSSIGGDRYAVPAAAWPEGAVDPAYINLRWIPLSHDGSGNHIGLDFDPWPRGRVGQVILFGRDEDVKVVLADSLGKFLEWIADLLESGNFRLDEEAGVLRPFRLKVPAVDHFHEGARILLGAPGQFL